MIPNAYMSFPVPAGHVYNCFRCGIDMEPGTLYYTAIYRGRGNKTDKVCKKCRDERNEYALNHKK